MNTTIFLAIHTLAVELDEYFQRCPFVFKASESNTSFEPSFPTIYEFCIPPQDRNSVGYPVNSPAIAIVAEELNASDVGDIEARISIHIAVCNPSTMVTETVDGNNQAGYEFEKGAGYTQDNAFIDLYAACLRLGEETLTALSHADSVRLSELTLNTPDVNLPDFPFAACVITGLYKYQKTFRSVNPQIAQYL